jgi:hypothetical protein
LIEALDALGYTTRHIAQEHSYVKDMWQRISNPDVLIFLQASYPVASQRKGKTFHWSEADYNEQQHRLAHAREHANLLIDTNNLSIQEVLDQVLAFIQNTTG